MRNRLLRIAGLMSLPLFCVLLVSPLLQDDSAPEVDPRLRAALIQQIGQQVASDATRLFGSDAPRTCIMTETLAACIHPDTPPERVQEILDSMPVWDREGRYALSDHWSETAIDGDAGNTGAPINLTYSFLDDGVMIPGANGEPASASRLYLTMNGHFGSEDVWKPMFAQIFADWGKHIGVSYQEVSDDGAAFPNTPGELGLRGDVRIGCHPIDGQYGILAYNFYPDGGDMVIDSTDNWGNSYNNYVFLRNVVRHEHGHGLGFGHVTPENCQKLMEAYACLNFDGPQDDDIRGGMRNYGDTLERNNTAATATDLGVLQGPYGFDWPVSLTTSVDFDYYRFSTLGPAQLDVVVDPVGSHYILGDDIVDTDQIMDLAFRVLGGENGSDMLLEVDDVGVGGTEMLSDFPLPAAGDYWVLVFRAGGTPDVQRYDITFDVELTDITAAPRDLASAGELAPSLYPNPFNPRTTMRFHAAAAGPVELSIYDLAGHRVRRVAGQATAAGWQELSWDGRTDGGSAAPSGTYLMRARSGQQEWTTRGVLIE